LSGGVYTIGDEIHIGLEGLDVFEGNLGIGVVGGTHLELDNDIGGSAYLGEVSLKAGQGASHNSDWLAQLEVIGGDGHRIGSIAEHVLEALHLEIGEGGKDTEIALGV
jgi:hypothetical protein